MSWIKIYHNSLPLNVKSSFQNVYILTVTQFSFSSNKPINNKIHQILNWMLAEHSIDTWNACRDKTVLLTKKEGNCGTNVQEKVTRYFWSGFWMKIPPGQKVIKKRNADSVASISDFSPERHCVHWKLNFFRLRKSGTSQSKRSAASTFTTTFWAR